MNSGKFAQSAQPPSYLKWSESAITFDRQDHQDRVPNSESYPLIVDPISAETRLTKVLMDRGSGLNILYAETLALMGISKSRLRNDASPFHGVVPGHRAHPLRQIDLPVCFGTPTTSDRRSSPSMWSGSQEPTTRS